MKQNMQDLTEGPLGKKILIFSVPLMLSNLLQVLFNMADIAVIGQFAGSLSLGAVGSTATLVTMFTGFLIGLSGGINVLTALYYGAKDRESLSKTIHSAALVSLIMGVLLLVLGVGLSEWMLTMLKTSIFFPSGAAFLFLLFVIVERFSVFFCFFGRLLFFGFRYFFGGGNP